MGFNPSTRNKKAWLNQFAMGCSVGHFAALSLNLTTFTIFSSSFFAKKKMFIVYHSWLFFLHLCKRQKWNRRLRCTLLWSINIVKCVKSSTKGSWLNAHGETYSICLWIIRPLAAMALHREAFEASAPQRALWNAPWEATEPRPQVHLQHRFTAGFITS